MFNGPSFSVNMIGYDLILLLDYSETNF